MRDARTAGRGRSATSTLPASSPGPSACACSGWQPREGVVLRELGSRRDPGRRARVEARWRPPFGQSVLGGRPAARRVTELAGLALPRRRARRPDVAAGARRVLPADRVAASSSSSRRTCSRGRWLVAAALLLSPLAPRHARHGSTATLAPGLPRRAGSRGTSRGDPRRLRSRPAIASLRDALRTPAVAILAVGGRLSAIGVHARARLLRSGRIDGDALAYHLARAAFWKQ